MSTPLRTWGGARLRADGLPPITLTHDGRTQTIAAWEAEPACKALGLTAMVMRNRVRLGWDARTILTTPVAPRVRRADKPLPPVVDSVTRYVDDPVAQAAVRCHPGGMSHPEVGALFGITRERIRQIEGVALRKVRARLALVGLDEDDLALVLGRGGVDYAESGE